MSKKRPKSKSSAPDLNRGCPSVGAGRRLYLPVPRVSYVQHPLGALDHGPQFLIITVRLERAVRDYAGEGTALEHNKI